MTYKWYDKDAVSKSAVLATWKGILENEKDIPTDWTGETVILVGIERYRREDKAQGKYGDDAREFIETSLWTTSPTLCA